MRRIVTWLMSTISALVLLFSYHTSTSSSMPAITSTAPQRTDSGSSGTDSGSSGGDSGSSGADSGSSDGAAGAGADGTYLGDAIDTRFGPVQVQITVSGGVIDTSIVTQVPWSDHRDQEINSYAVPILNSEAVEAQSSDIDMVSGATITSRAYIASLQSAIDQAGL
jgi:uncharacterized protein with FMN-binding domain